MNWTVLIFAVAPLAFSLVGVVGAIVFGPDILRRYNQRRHEQREDFGIPRREPVMRYISLRYEPASTRDREPVHH